MKKLFTIILMTFLCMNTQQAKAQYTKLLDFGGVIDGYDPDGSLISDGTFLYGMTTYSGANSGTIFKIKADGSGYAKLWDFGIGTDGKNPLGSLITDGTFLYGMTMYGGTKDSGTVFKIKTDGSGYLKLLDLGTTKGSFPMGSLLYDGTFLYGMTGQGGLNNQGAIFKIKPDGSSYTKLLDFAGTTNGIDPEGSLISDGTFLYGMTEAGGINNKGTIFKIMPNGTGYVKLLDFAGTTNGSTPIGDLISDGIFLYGMTYMGGTSDSGTVFKIKPDGTNYTKLLNFSGAANGGWPRGSLVYDGTFLYGMTPFGGINNAGVIFKIMPNGTNYVKILDLNFPNGDYPDGSLILNNGCLYGMTGGGGTNNDGVIFSLCGIMDIGEARDNNEQFSIYPNPTNGQFIIGTNIKDKQTLDIYDVNGRHVFNASVSDKENINVETLDNGAYTLTIKTAGRVINKKLVIIH